MLNFIEEPLDEVTRLWQTHELEGEYGDNGTL
jgi:hypothetical protein